MTQPAPAEQIRSLAALTGASGPLPEDSASRDVLLLKMITEALGRGLTWAQVASALGSPNGKAAKKAAKALARAAQSRMLRQEATDG